MKAGDLVKLIGVPPDLRDVEDLRTRALFQKCLGLTFMVSAVESGEGLPYPLARLDVGHILGEQPRMHTIWVEPQYLQLQVISLGILRFKDLESGIPLYSIIRVAHGSILCFISYERAGDIEVAFQIEECRPIIAIFEQALEVNVNHIRSTEHSQSLFTHRFKNLDGGEDATFAILVKDGTLEITVNRSDEGDLAFRVGFEDAKRLTDALYEALKVESALPPD